MPLTANFVGEGIGGFFRELYAPSWKPVLAGLLVLVLLTWLAPAAPGAKFLALFWRGGMVGLVTIAVAWPQLRAMRAQQS